MSLSLPTLCYRLATSQAVTNVTPQTITGFSVPVAANQRINWRFSGAFTLGATGGFRFIVTPPAGIVDFLALWNVVDLTTPTVFYSAQTSSAAFTNASAVASTYYITASGSIQVGTTAGNVLLQFAQNNNQATPITMLEGSFLSVERYSSDTN